VTPARPKRARGETPRTLREEKALKIKAAVIKGSRLPPPMLCCLGRDKKTGKTRWQLAKQYRYKDGSGDIIIPKGFVFDLASVPRMLWWLIAPFELSVVAALVHDYLCCTGGVKGRYTPLAAHQIFYTIMRAENVAAWRAVPAYFGVILFGPKRWT